MHHSTIAGLRLAQKVLDRRGWIQGATGSSHRGYCLIGAIHAAAGPVECERELAKDLGLSLTIPDLSIWNDAPERTYNEVIGALQATIDRLETEQRDAGYGYPAS